MINVVERVRARLLCAVDVVNARRGGVDETPELRAAIEAWPDPEVVARLPQRARAILDRVFGGGL